MTPAFPARHTPLKYISSKTAKATEKLEKPTVTKGLLLPLAGSPSPVFLEQTFLSFLFQKAFQSFLRGVVSASTLAFFLSFYAAVSTNNIFISVST